jgi:hypothetical protein
VLEGSSDSDDVDECIGAPYLVEMDVVRVDAVNARFGSGKVLEGAERALAHLLVERGVFEQPLHPPVGTRLTGILDIDLGPRGPDPGAADLLDPQRPARDAEGIDALRHVLERSPCVQERSEKYVAGDAGEAVQEQDGHAFLHLRIRRAA